MDDVESGAPVDHGDDADNFNRLDGVSVPRVNVCIVSALLLRCACRVPGDAGTGRGA